MTQAPAVPINVNDSDEQVLLRVLETVRDLGPMSLDQMVDVLQLYHHRSAEKILAMAMGDGMIIEDHDNGQMMLSELGHDVSQEIAESLGGGHGNGSR